MKIYLTSILFPIFAFVSFGQTPSVAPTQLTLPKDERAKTFGSSIEKYKNKKQQNYQNNRKNNESDNEEVVQVNTDLVINDVLVTDQTGKIITNLKKEDFIITEDDTSQTVEVFSDGENSSFPRSIVLIISSSVTQLPYFKSSVQGAKLLIDKLNPNDKMAIVTGDLELLNNFTTDKILLKKSLDSLDEKYAKKGVGSSRYNLLKNWYSPSFKNLLAVLNEIFAAEDSRRIIIFQGDGNDVVWIKKDKDAPYPISKSTRENSGARFGAKETDFGFSDIKEAIEKSRVTIYSAIPGIRFLGFSEKEQMARAKISLENVMNFSGYRYDVISRAVPRFQETEIERHIAGQTAMSKVAELSGGGTYFVEKPKDAENAYANIFENIKHRYVIGYYPTNQERDGKRRTVKIEVKDHPEYIVIGRKSYIPREN